MVQLGSGLAVFPGLLLLVATVSLSSRCRSRLAGVLRNLAGWTALVLIVSSATPFPLPAYVIFLICFGLWIAGENIERVRQVTGTRWPRLASIAAALVLLGLELPHVLPPTIPPVPGFRVYVIGDSISAGLAPGTSRWPELMAAKYRIALTNLAMAGATTEDAMIQAARIRESAALVVVEIGGNDLFYGRSSARFEQDLDRLLGKLGPADRTIVMLELPLFPLYDGYGRAQRAMARKYRAYLIPKRYFVSALSAPGATDDGLHLSASGAERMADTLYPLLAPALGRRN